MIFTLYFYCPSKPTKLIHNSQNITVSLIFQSKFIISSKSKPRKCQHDKMLLMATKFLYAGEVLNHLTNMLIDEYCTAYCKHKYWIGKISPTIHNNFDQVMVV